METVPTPLLIVSSHLTKLGIAVKNDGGLLFALAVIVLTCSRVAAYIRRRQTPWIGSAL